MYKTIREQRFEKVFKILSNHKIKSLIEFGCGDGKFIPYAQKLKFVNRITVIDKNEKKIDKIKNKYNGIECHCKSFLEYKDSSNKYDCLIAIEVIEHLNKDELQCLKGIVFEMLTPKYIVFTTPNKEYNVNYPNLYNGLRHTSHIFEFTPKELNIWGNEVIQKYNNYHFNIGFCDHNNSSQYIVFKRRED